MELLNGITRAYPWGSRTMIPALRGRPTPAESPEAELWYGAHPAGASTIAGSGAALDDVIAADPENALGTRVNATFQSRLPFLVKILAADQPLSLQAHPSREQAADGFDRENRAGIPIDAANRNYRDDNHKPEILIALTEFQAMAGFRPLAQTRELFDALSCPACERYLPMLQPGPADEADLRGLFTTWITIPADTRYELIDAIVECARERSDRDDWIGEALRNVVELNERYPGDVGVLGALLLNHVTLRPGEAIYLHAGQLHAYLHGMGVEVQSNSDNVLRGGLTSKYVDVPELVRVLEFRELDQPLIEPRDGERGLPEGAASYPVPIDDFQVRTGSPGQAGWVIDRDAPSIVLCVSGEVTCGTKRLRAGDAAWIPASDAAVELSGAGTVAWVTC